MNRRFALITSGALLALARPASAQELRYHLDASGARAAAGIQQSEFGLGAGGEVAVELPVKRVLGFQVEAGGVWLSHGSPSSTGVQNKSDGDVAAAMLGVRFHPAREAGLWLDANIGGALTGPLVLPAVDTHLGYDVALGGDGLRWDVGPFVGYEQIFEPAGGAFPGDAHIALFGVHVSVGSPTRRAAKPHAEEMAQAAPAVERRAPDPEPNASAPVLVDTDGDGIADASDACPTVPGIVTDDPATNGCPLPMRGVSVSKGRDRPVRPESSSTRIEPRSNARPGRP